MINVTLTVDGSEWGGYMGCGIVAECGSIRKTYAEGPGEGSCQRAELMAAILALKKLKGDLSQYQVTLRTDSQYVIGVLTQNWRPRVHQALVCELQTLAEQCLITVEKIMGEKNPAHGLAREGVRKSVGMSDVEDPFAHIPDAVCDIQPKQKKQKAVLSAREVRQVAQGVKTEAREHRYGTGKTHEVVCGRCQGTGTYRQYGKCYRCAGKGFQTIEDKRRNWGYDINNQPSATH